MSANTFTCLLYTSRCVSETDLVDLIYVADDKDQVTLSDGILADDAPTLLSLMGLKQPAEMSGHSLVTPGK